LSGWWDSFLRWLGFAVCHQLPDRTIHFGNRPLFLCARDTGLYVGFFLCLAVAVIPYRMYRGGLPSLPWKVGMAASLLYLAADGMTVALGWREGSNVLRLTSGLAAGASLALLLGPAVNRMAFQAPRERRLLQDAAPVAVLAGSLSAASALFLIHPSPLLLPAQLLLLACFAGTLLYLNASFALAILLAARAGGGKKVRGTAALISLPLTAVELVLLHRLHALLAR